MAARSKYSAEVRERAVRMVQEQGERYASQWEAIRSIAGKLGCSPEALRKWVRRRRSTRGSGRAYGVEPYDNALAETINGLYKAELIRPNGPWRGIEEVEFATLEWVDWFNNRRLLSSIGDVPPAEFEAM